MPRLKLKNKEEVGEWIEDNTNEQDPDFLLIEKNADSSYTIIYFNEEKEDE